MIKELIERLRTHNDDRLYFEADVLMAEAADALEAQQKRIEEQSLQILSAQAQAQENYERLVAAQAEIAHWRTVLEVLSPPHDDSALRELLKAERERCAKVLDERAMKNEKAAQDCLQNGEPDEVSSLRSAAWQLSVCAAAIRAMEDQ